MKEVRVGYSHEHDVGTNTLKSVRMTTKVKIANWS